MPSYLAKTNICKNIKTSRTCKETNIKRAALWALLTSNSSIAPKTNLDCWMHGKCNYLRISLPFSNIQVIAQSSYVPYEHTITIPFNKIKNLQLNKHDLIRIQIWFSHVIFTHFNQFLIVCLSQYVLMC